MVWSNRLGSEAEIIIHFIKDTKKKSEKGYVSNKSRFQFKNFIFS